MLAGDTYETAVDRYTKHGTWSLCSAMGFLFGSVISWSVDSPPTGSLRDSMFLWSTDYPVAWSLVTWGLLILALSNGFVARLQLKELAHRLPISYATDPPPFHSIFGRNLR